ncbi:uncharacterized protein A1O9_02758 [Exophiala aquamarina CBS 119918]|uniref:BTB domain-containing protein n=1 Tax=Exophiala aquamarina CBS 119918 TaxID=1182545 RepID=A0A072PPC8_9EURO|nr:uncharacterized protein A1O9_02758 [Exophiala aquamarina CBS 119918]KEF61193.1 hypothetical protein A1O9_02758 [Exophiala aquamarina CBS 119918]
MAASEKSEFPKFIDGDVLVIISTTQMYRLHHQILESHSTYFKNAIAKQPGACLNAQARRDNAPAYRFEWLPGTTSGTVGRFVRIDISDSGRAQNALPQLPPDLVNGKVDNNDNKAWDWLFGLFYNRPPAFDDSNLASVLSGVISLIDRAECIDSLKIVCDAVDLALLRQDTVLWTSILGNPPVWVELGCRVRSPSIFCEAACHLVGQWANMNDDEKGHIRKDIRKVLERKATELSIQKEAIELRILSHYPGFLHRTAADKPGRPSYSNDIYMWMSISFFRQWFAQCISDDRTRRAPDGGLNFYCALAEGGQSYLTHLDFQEFHRYFPMSIKACHVLEANMGVLKENIKPFVAPLVVQRTHLKRDEFDIDWLTCTEINKEDFPWYNPDESKPNQLDELYDTLGRENVVRAKATAAKKRNKEHPIDFGNDDEEGEDNVDFDAGVRNNANANANIRKKTTTKRTTAATATAAEAAEAEDPTLDPRLLRFARKRTRAEVDRDDGNPDYGNGTDQQRAMDVPVDEDAEGDQEMTDGVESDIDVSGLI